jgi:Bacterial Ig-like domain/PKD domain
VSRPPAVSPVPPSKRLRRSRLVSALAVLVASMAVPGLAAAADLNATPSTLAGVYASAQGGDVIHLAAGSYGTFSGGSKPSVVTLIAQPGATATMYPNLGAGVNNLRLDGLTLQGMFLSGARNVAIVNSRFTDMSRIDTPAGVSNANILIDHNTFDGITACGTCYEGRLSVRGYDNTAPVGVSITNNHFGNGGCSDGIQVIGNAYGVQVGPGNEFSGIRQNGCSNHVDSIQLYGSRHTQIVGNYFHDDDTIIMAPDGGDHEVITDNVMIGAGYSAAVQLGSQDTTTFSHNTVVDVSVRLGSKTGGEASSNGTNDDNVMLRSGFSIDGSGCSCSFDHNLYSSSGDSRGTNATVATPAFVGGASPTTYSGYQLAANSPGRGNGSDGKDLGARIGASTPPPPDTTAPDTTITSGPTGPITDSTPTFAFTSEAGAVFECRVDSGAWADCTSPWTTAALASGPHTVAVRATDEAGNTDATPATRSFTVGTTPPPDTTAPDTTITSGPTGTTNDTTPTFAFTSEAGAVFECRVDATPWANCVSPWTTAALSDGPHTVSVRATDAAGNTDATPATQSFTVGTAPPPDTTAPDTTITSGPTGTTDDATPTFAFTSEANAVFECRVDTGAWAACTSPWTTATLGDGPHSVSVRATDVAGNTDATPATRSFTVAAGAPGGDSEPVAAFTYSPAAPAVGQAVSFDASSATCDDAPCSYAWVDDGTDGPGGTQWPLGTGKTLPFTFQGEGVKRVRVTVTDADDDTDSTMKAITVGAPAPPSDTTAPQTSITSGPSDTTAATSASFAFTSTEPASTFECKLDAAAYAACTSPKDYSALSAGSHTFSVRAADAAGNTDATPAARTWTIEAAPPPDEDHAPVAAFTYSPAAPAVGQAVSFDASSATCDDAPCSYAWVDDGTDGPGGTQWPLGTGKTLSFTFQGEGVKRVRVTVTDADGDTDSTMKAITVGATAPPDNPPSDTTGPDTTIASGPEPVTNDNTPTFVLAATEIGSTFSCQVDAGQVAQCTSPWTTPALPDGSHRVAVSATDAAGNADASPATRSFRVDTQAPETTIESAPPGVSSATSATLTFHADESGATFECRLDWRAWADCTSPKTFTGLSVNRHSAYVRATDAAGNVESSPARAWWRTTAP